MTSSRSAKTAGEFRREPVRRGPWGGRRLLAGELKATMLVLLLTASFMPVMAQTPDPPASPAPAPSLSEPKPSQPDPIPAEPDYSVSTAMDEIGRFTGQIENYENDINEWRTVESLKTAFATVEETLARAEREFSRKHRLSSWDFRMAGEFKLNLKPLFDDAGTIRADYVDFLKGADKLLKEAEAQRAYFVAFQSHIRNDPQLSNERLATHDALKDADKIIARVKKDREAYAKAYQNNAAVLDRVAVLEKQLRREIKAFRRSHFQKTSPAFFSPEFRADFDDRLKGELRVSWNSVTDVDWEWVGRNNLTAINLMLAFAAFYGLIRWLNRRREWEGVFQQPVGLSLTAAGITVGLFVADPIPAVTVLSWVILCCLLLILIRAYPVPAWQSGDIATLVIVYGVLQITDTFGLPLPVYRLLLTAASAALALYVLVRRQRALRLGAGALYVSGSGFLSIVFAVTAVAESLGYHLLSALVMRGMVKSLFLLFAVWNLRFLAWRLVFSGIDGALSRLRMTHIDSGVLRGKLSPLLNSMLAVAMVALLAAVWGAYDSVGSAFGGVWDLGVSLKEYRLTVGMALTAIVSLYIVTALADAVCHILENEFYPRRQIQVGTGKSINALIVYAGWVIGLIGGLEALGFELSRLAIIAGALSVGIGFGLQTIVNNFVSGLILLFERPIKAGDLLNINGQWGTVEKVGLRSTVIRSATKSQLIIPNSDFVTHTVENLTFSDSEGRITIPVGVAYGSEVEKVRSVLVASAVAHPKVLNDPSPEALFIAFGESSLNFELWAWVDDVAGRRNVQSEILVAIEQSFRAEGIVIPFPQREIRVKSA